MCGIVAIFSNKDESQDVEKMLDAISHRGIDGRGIVSHNGITIGHNRLAINDLSESGNQPFELDSLYSVTNGEIWNEKQLKDTMGGYTFKSTSDCEILLPLYKEGRLKELDGMFSTIILDGEKMVITRDWVGKMPLWFTIDDDRLIVASEVKAIREVSNCEDVKIVPPNSMITVTSRDEVLGLEFDMDIQHNYYDWINNVQILTEETTSEEVSSKTYELLDNAVKSRLIGDVSIATLNSGGIDSSIITYLAKQYVSDLTCYTVAFAEDSIDLKHARLLRDYLGVNMVEVHVPRNEEEIKERFVDVCRTIEYPSNVQVQCGIMLSYVAQQIAKDGHKIALSGELSDEVAGSYGRNRMFANKPDWTTIKKQQVERQHYGNLIRSNNIFMKYGTIECRMPFFDRDYVDYVANLPSKLTTGKKKQYKKHLADAFRGKIPDQIIDRDKESFQKGTSFKDWFEELILSDDTLNRNNRKKLHYVIQDVIVEQLNYKVRKCRDLCESYEYK